jgi:hypothetical protein
VNVIEFIRFVAMLLIAGAALRLFELHFAGRGGMLGDLAQGLGVIY